MNQYSQSLDHMAQKHVAALHAARTAALQAASVRASVLTLYCHSGADVICLLYQDDGDTSTLEVLQGFPAIKTYVLRGVLERHTRRHPIVQWYHMGHLQVPISMENGTFIGFY